MKGVWPIILFLFTYLHLNSQMITNRDSLKEVIDATNEETSKINALWNLGFSYAFVHQDSAIQYANEGLELSKKINYVLGEAYNSMVLSMALTLQGNYTSALQYGFRFLSIGERLRDSMLIARAYAALEICYREQEDYSEALKYVYKAEAITRTPAYRAYRPLILGDICVIYERLNRLDSALYYGLQSYNQIKNWSGIYLKLGTVYAKLGKPDSALFYYRAGIPYALEFFIYIDLVDIYNKMSELFQATGHIDSAIYYGNKSIIQEGGLSYSEGRIRAATHLANLYESLGEKDSTLKYYKLSLKLNQKLFDRQKIREAQGLAFNEKIHQQELQAQKEKENNRVKTYGLLGVAIVFLAIAFILWRNNYQKQKAKAKIEAAYAELKNTQAQLVQSEKMASLGELTAGIAHEIQNPLNFVNNFSDVNKELLIEMNEEIEKGNLNEVISIAKDVIDNEEKINHHGKRADAIVKGMLQHSRTSSGVKEPIDVNALVDEYLRLAYHGMRAKDKSFNAITKTDFDESIGKINVIPQDIGRVILNLINNALYAVDEKKKQVPPSPKGEEETASYKYEPIVTVTTKRLGPSLGRARAGTDGDRGKPDGYRVEIRVADNGNGIPKNVLDKVFQPFFTTKPAGQGTGLGLSLSYDIVTAHGGELKVETQEGERTTFTIYLPA
ncbi:MAG TPA: ATP-binding protein [Chitinophagaceae bacterium]|nr:ATP-binding protein [Chitinophagaceae bacterium]